MNLIWPRATRLFLLRQYKTCRQNALQNTKKTKTNNLRYFRTPFTNEAQSENKTETQKVLLELVNKNKEWMNGISVRLEKRIINNFIDKVVNGNVFAFDKISAFFLWAPFFGGFNIVIHWLMYQLHNGHWTDRFIIIYHSSPLDVQESDLFRTSWNLVES